MQLHWNHHQFNFPLLKHNGNPSEHIRNTLLQWPQVAWRSFPSWSSAIQTHPLWTHPFSAPVFFFNVDDELIQNCLEFGCQWRFNLQIFIPTHEPARSENQWNILMEEIRRSPADMANIPLFAKFCNHPRWLFFLISEPSTVALKRTGAENCTKMEDGSASFVTNPSWEKNSIKSQGGGEHNWCDLRCFPPQNNAGKDI